VLSDNSSLLFIAIKSYFKTKILFKNIPGFYFLVVIFYKDEPSPEYAP
jgi:hypothetical protein